MERLESMENISLQKLKHEIMRLHESVEILKTTFPSKKEGFTLDGRLVGDIGEVIAEELFQIKLHEKLQHHYDDGDYKVIYNGPGKYISEAFKHRKGIGKQLLSFPIDRLKEINAEIPDNERILNK